MTLMMWKSSAFAFDLKFRNITNLCLGLYVELMFAASVSCFVYYLSLQVSDNGHQTGQSWVACLCIWPCGDLCCWFLPHCHLTDEFMWRYVYFQYKHRVKGKQTRLTTIQHELTPVQIVNVCVSTSAEYETTKAQQKNKLFWISWSLLDSWPCAGNYWSFVPKWNAKYSTYSWSLLQCRKGFTEKQKLFSWFGNKGRMSYPAQFSPFDECSVWKETQFAQTTFLPSNRKQRKEWISLTSQLPSCGSRCISTVVPISTVLAWSGTNPIPHHMMPAWFVRSSCTQHYSFTSLNKNEWKWQDSCMKQYMCSCCCLTGLWILPCNKLQSWLKKIFISEQEVCQHHQCHTQTHTASFWNTFWSFMLLQTLDQKTGDLCPCIWSPCAWSGKSREIIKFTFFPSSLSVLTSALWSLCESRQSACRWCTLQCCIFVVIPPASGCFVAWTRHNKAQNMQKYVCLYQMSVSYNFCVICLCWEVFVSKVITKTYILRQFTVSASFIKLLSTRMTHCKAEGTQTTISVNSSFL